MQCLLRERGQEWRGGWLSLSHSELHRDAEASASSLGPWEGCREMQSLMMPKIPVDCGLAPSQGFPSPYPPTPSPPAKIIFVFIKLPETSVGTETTNISSEEREEGQKQLEAI